MTGSAANDAECIDVALGRFGAVVDRGLREVLAEDGDVRILGEALDDAALPDFLAREAPRVVVLNDASLAEQSFCERLCAVGPEVGVVVVSQWRTPGYGARLLASGVAMCMSIDASASDIRRAVRLAAAGTQALAPLEDCSIQVTHLTGIASLTLRERDVLRLLSLGEGNAAIALRLTISIETARSHVKNIFRKLGVATRRELVGVAVPDNFW